jgi:hypothetical protein
MYEQGASRFIEHRESASRNSINARAFIIGVDAIFSFRTLVDAKPFTSWRVVNGYVSVVDEIDRRPPIVVHLGGPNRPGVKTAQNRVGHRTKVQRAPTA